MEQSHHLLADKSGYKVSLLRVAPGAEAQVAAKLGKYIKKDTGEEPMCLLKLFGRFDLCAVYKTKDYLDGPSKFGAIEGIRGGIKINAFHWLDNNEQPGLSVAKATGNVWAISFFRYNESLVKLFGARIEDVVTDVSHNQGSRKVVVDVLGTTGWAEQVIIIRGDTFEEVAGTLSRISRKLVQYDIGAVPTS